MKSSYNSSNLDSVVSKIIIHNNTGGGYGQPGKILVIYKAEQNT